MTQGSTNRAKTKKRCTSCPRPNRKHQEYGLRLSWPRSDDRRRAVVCNSAPPSPGQVSNARFIHTSHWDIELHYRLTGSPLVRNVSLLSVPVSWSPSKLQALDSDLLQYFSCVASKSLATFGHDAPSLANILIHLALQADTTTTSTAVLHALLAFSSLHRYGLQAQSLELKVAALGSLAKGLAGASLGAMASIQHIATEMLLCAYEIHQSSCTAGQWTFHLGGAMTMLHAFSVSQLYEEFGADFAVLLDWVHYHSVLAKFAILLRKREGALERLPSFRNDFFTSELSSLPLPVYSLLSLLSQVCDAVSSARRANGHPTTVTSMDDHKSFLEILDWRIRSLSMPDVPDTSHHPPDEFNQLLQLYQLAILIFFNRCFPSLLDQPLRTQQHIGKGFSVLSLLSSCRQQFPIYVIGCEAQTDEQRAVVLDAISRTEKSSTHSQSLNYCRRILEAIWAQDDLAGGKSLRLSYCERMTSVMSQCSIVPIFV
ncbi:fungal-specific transcription factor domain-containing protein [Aspergillus karnatakaensis]|uniref:transcription factor domain-containing protein n=1 Tax=Aspergillus karnatakaensis TaxID=1810916 RepID=UPI003CCD4224